MGPGGEAPQFETMQIPRVLLLIIALMSVLYAAKIWVLYVVMEPIMGFLNPEAEPAEDLDVLQHPSEGGPTAPTSQQYQEAVAALGRNDFAKALKALGECSEEPACITLHGEIELIGAERTTKNLTSALSRFKAAADQGNSDAQYALAIMYTSLKFKDLLKNETNVTSEAYRDNEALAVLYLYAASVSGHPGALMAMGYRHYQGYGVTKSCDTAALNYIEVAKRIADIYSAGMPQAVELIRLNLGSESRKAMTTSEINFFVQIAANGDVGVAAAIGKRYLLGLDGLKQNYKKAAKYLKIAAENKHSGALALLGYMYCLGLGVEANLDAAYSYFVSSSTQKDALGHNGLGYIYFTGTPAHDRDMKLAFHHFNESAHGGSADGMFNLASMYLTGSGTERSFQRAVLWYTQALDRGHTPAAYALAVIHLNGVGTIRDCEIAVNLLKKVCERGGWVSSKLQVAYDQQEIHPSRSAWNFLKLAEAGHEVAQMNLAYLLDTGNLYLFADGPVVDELNEELKSLNKVFAQRFYEMSASQGSASSELRLGDYAYYGWGITMEEESEAEFESVEDAALALHEEAQAQYIPQPVDYEASIAHYKRTSEMMVTGEWMQSFVARAFFNLAFMYQFGLGVPMDLSVARRNYHRCLEVDPSGVHTPVSVMLIVLTFHGFFLRLPNPDAALDALTSDPRIHLILLLGLSVLVLVVVRKLDRKSVV